MTDHGNLYSNIPADNTEEVIEVLLRGKGVVIERIVSNAQTSSENEWYDQATDEWVLMVQGTGELLYEDGSRLVMKAGDYVFIPRHRKHRVTHTDPDTIWLAIHLE